jgi:hypothetical protein
MDDVVRRSGRCLQIEALEAMTLDDLLKFVPEMLATLHVEGLAQGIAGVYFDI